MLGSCGGQDAGNLLVEFERFGWKFPHIQKSDHFADGLSGTVCLVFACLDRFADFSGSGFRHSTA
jgi:hypothetical protein